MRPIRLEIEGFQSFKERQIIDFEKLCSFGIFGIFGETGSGKSTILDAIILAIYGKISKELGQQEDGLTNFLNNFSDKMEIYFKFALGEDIFEITRNYYLGKEKGAFKLKSRDPIMKKNGYIVAGKAKELEEKIKEEFGLNMDDFTRTIVLPQGKFSDFLKLRGKDKKEAIARIFNMEEYGKKLKEKANLQKKSLENQKYDLENQKNMIEPTSKDEIETFKNILSSNKKYLEKLNLEKINFDKYYSEISNLKSLLENRKILLKEKEKLELLKDSIDLKKEKLEKSSKASEINEYISKKEESISKLALFKTDLDKNIITKNNLENKLQIIKENIEKLENTFQEIEQKKETIDFDRTKYLNISNAYLEKKLIIDKEKTLKKYQENIFNFENQLKSYIYDLKILSEEKEKTDKNILNISKIDDSVLDILKNQIFKLKTIIDQYEKNQKEKNEIDISLKNKEIEKIKLEEEKRNVLENLEYYEKEKIKNIAFELSKTLEEGKPCPVCGSTTHVRIDFESINKNSIEKNIASFSSRKDKLIEEISNINTLINEKTLIKENLKISHNGIILDDNSLENLKTEVKDLENEYTSKKIEIEMAKEKLSRLQNEKTRIESNIENNKINISREKNSLEKSKLEIKNIQNEIENTIQKIEKDYMDISLEKLKEKKETLEKNEKLLDILEIESKNILELKNQKSKNKDSCNNELNEVNMEILKLNSHINHLTENIQNDSLTINLLLEKHNFSNIEEVKNSYLKEKEKDKISKEIKEFDDNFIKNSNLLDELDKKIDEKTLEDEEWKEINNKKIDLENSLTDLKINISNLEKDLEIKRKNLKILDELNSNLRKIDKKLAIAEDIYMKLRAKDFVSFLVNKKLKNVIEMASYRLNKISNGRYQLTSDEESNFYVVDFFNDGKKRRTATLSGGETFVVSLCLALALSKQLQFKGKKPLEFFFLDEGFGSLDSKLLDKVMDSIENIRNEEKIKIGIITHLEELKLRILKRIEVEKAIPGERGSKIKLI